jgi:hypothetical protein
MLPPVRESFCGRVTASLKPQHPHQGASKTRLDLPHEILEVFSVHDLTTIALTARDHRTRRTRNIGLDPVRRSNCTSRLPVLSRPPGIELFGRASRIGTSVE